MSAKTLVILFAGFYLGVLFMDFWRDYAAFFQDPALLGRQIAYYSKQAPLSLYDKAFPAAFVVVSVTMTLLAVSLLLKRFSFRHLVAVVALLAFAAINFVFLDPAKATIASLNAANAKNESYLAAFTAILYSHSSMAVLMVITYWGMTGAEPQPAPKEKKN